METETKRKTERVSVCKKDMIYETVWTVAPFIISSIKSSQSWNEDVKILQQTTIKLYSQLPDS